ncbi:Golgi transport protein-like protein [Fimicolochytrium jonesii]|uniref:Golgi transport protein-like protein n=1 Tax=Fimicolochytrium jonesii TaxID=1396493 RepID=UPI0022FED64D|nr:Golgi transport protein-like protein [Fimicolochytrium jonesii]KAI8820153.1 Golgi transport protein-like protein [Fimicolochytrium jonesii]
MGSNRAQDTNTPTKKPYQNLRISPSSSSTEFGAASIAAGALFFALGVMLLLDKGLMAVGNILFLLGLPLLLGPTRTIGFFSRADRRLSTASLLTGIVLVLVKWPFVGLVLEGVGVVNLFGPFIPTIYGFVRGIVGRYVGV